MKKDWTFYIGLLVVLMGLFGIWVDYSAQLMFASIIAVFAGIFYCTAYVFKFLIDK